MIGLAVGFEVHRQRSIVFLVGVCCACVWCGCNRELVSDGCRTYPNAHSASFGPWRGVGDDVVLG